MSNVTTLLVQIIVSGALIVLAMLAYTPIRRRTRNATLARLPLIAVVILVVVAFAWSFGVFNGTACDATSDPGSCGAVALPSAN